MSLSTPRSAAALAPELALRPVLVVEDDAADALLAEEMLLEVMPQVTVRRAARLADVAPALADDQVACVLLDLGLPDAQGPDVLHHVLDLAGQVPVIVLTGLDDESSGIDAVAAGAQDYLVKGRLDADRLARAVRYAVERRRADDNLMRLRESELRAAENARLERGLLPTPLVGQAVSCQVRYRPGRERALLGGDFYDVIETADGGFTAVVGDVCGHGPDEAALGASLRIGWRSLVLAGLAPERVLDLLDDLLVAERGDDETYVTLCQVTVGPDRRQATVHLAGHPPPVICGPTPRVAVDSPSGPPLGLGLGLPAVGTPVTLQHGESLLLYTDGLIEGRVQPGGEDRLGIEGLIALLREQAEPALPDLDTILGKVEALDGGVHADDRAAVLLVPRWDHRG